MGQFPRHRRADNPTVGTACRLSIGMKFLWPAGRPVVGRRALWMQNGTWRKVHRTSWIPWNCQHLAGAGLFAGTRASSETRQDPVLGACRVRRGAPIEQDVGAGLPRSSGSLNMCARSPGAIVVSAAVCSCRPATSRVRRCAFKGPASERRAMTQSASLKLPPLQLARRGGSCVTAS